jgi:nucleotide-binding universal stress UspA family protein
MYKRILMAYDGSPEYRRALRQGSELAELTNAEVHLLAVIRSSAAMPMAGGVNTSEVVNEEHSEVQKLLNDGVERIRERHHVECTGSIGYGDPVDEIENAARDFDADLVVIGTRKLDGLDRWWRKRIGKHLIDRLPCSLLIAIPPEDFEPSSEA